MTEYKFISIFKTFSEEEMEMFEKFISSPFLSSGKNCLPLFKQIKKFYPAFDNKKLTYEYLYRKIYPGKVFNKQVMWNLSSAIEKSARGFLEQVALSKDDFKRKGLLLSEFKSRKLLNNYLNTMKEIEEQLTAEEIDYFYIEKKEMLEGYKLDYFYLIDKEQPMAESKLKDAEYHLLLFLRMLAGGLHDMNILNKNFNIMFNVNIPLQAANNLDLKRISDYAVENNYKYSFLIELYYHAITMILNPEIDEHFIKMRELYEKHYNKFTVSEKRNMMYWLLAYCRLKSERKNYKKIFFDLNKFRLKEGLVYYPGKQMSKGVFNNIFYCALEAGETKYAENFLKEYTHTLKKEHRLPVSSLAYAYLYFLLKKYDKVIEYTSKVVFTDTNDKIKLKILNAKTYYETGEIELLLHHTDSFMHFLNKNQSISQIQKNTFKKFFKYLKKLATLNEKYEHSGITELEREFKTAEELVDRKWLLEKLQEIKSRKINRYR